MADFQEADFLINRALSLLLPDVDIIGGVPDEDKAMFREIQKVERLAHT